MVFAKGGGPSMVKSPVVEKSVPAPIWLRPLCSKNESERFGVLETARVDIQKLRMEHMDQMLQHAQEFNFSTLVYLCLKEHSLLLGTLNDQQMALLAQQEGAFPNLAFYLGEVVPAEAALLKCQILEKNHPGQAMAIYKGMGMISSAASLKYLLELCQKGKNAGRDILAPLAGLAQHKNIIAFTDIQKLLGLPLTREETLLLAKGKTAVSAGEYETLLVGSSMQKLYATEKLLSDPAANATLITARVEKLIHEGRHEQARLLLNSDGLRRVNDPPLRKKLDELYKLTENPSMRR